MEKNQIPSGLFSSSGKNGNVCRVYPLIFAILWHSWTLLITKFQLRKFPMKWTCKIFIKFSQGKFYGFCDCAHLFFKNLKLFQSILADFVQVDLRHVDEVDGSTVIEIGVDLSEFYTSVEWDILEVPAVRYIECKKAQKDATDCMYTSKR